jgi:hypothetical protein
VWKLSKFANLADFVTQKKDEIFLAYFRKGKCRIKQKRSEFWWTHFDPIDSFFLVTLITTALKQNVWKKQISKNEKNQVPKMSTVPCFTLFFAKFFINLKITSPMSIIFHRQTSKTYVSDKKKRHKNRIFCTHKNS